MIGYVAAVGIAIVGVISLFANSFVIGFYLKKKKGQSNG